MGIVVRGAVAEVSFEEAANRLEEAAATLFDADPGLRSVGICRHGNGFGYRAVRNSPVVRTSGASRVPVTRFERIPVRVSEVAAEIQPLLKVPLSGPGSPLQSTLVPEAGMHRPLAAGLQIQNFDDDVRQDCISQGFISIGTLGCFATLADGSPAFLSNNHVAAGQNRGIRGEDRILQPGSAACDVDEHVGILHEYPNLLASPAGATPLQGNVVYNLVDAAAVRLREGVDYSRGFLPSHHLPAPAGVAPATLGAQVFKVGCATGLTFGNVEDVGTVVGRLPYGSGECWFESSILIEGAGGTLFADHGDSGAAVLTTAGEVIGLVYAGNGVHSYVCPIDEVLRALNCSLA